MSVNLFWNKKEQKLLTRQRLWAGVVTWILTLGFYGLGTLMLITREQGIPDIKADVLKNNYLLAVQRTLGFESIGYVLVAFLGVLLALQGFSYLFNSSQIDFYDSQPISRKGRFWQIYLGGLFTFLKCYLCSVLIAVVFALCFGAMSGPLFLEILIQVVRMLFLFLMTYSISVLAVMLTGTIQMAILLDVAFFFSQIVIAYVHHFYEVQFFKTYFAGSGEIPVYGSPVYYALATAARAVELRYSMGDAITMEYVTQIFRNSWIGDVITLGIGLIALCISYALFKKRKVEWAGESIVYTPVRVLLKLVVTILAALCSGLFIVIIYSNTAESTLINVLMPLGIIAGGALACVIYEIILGKRITFATKRLWQIPVTVVAALLIFGIYRFDFFGYDSYVPDASKVENCAVGFEYAGSSYYVGNDVRQSQDMRDFVSAYMKLTDVQAVEDLALESQEFLEEQEKKDYYEDTYDMFVIYRLKSGREVARRLTLPVDVQEQLMSRVVDTQEFREGFFQVYHDEQIQNSLHDSARIALEYGSSSEIISGADYRELRDAYLKDLESYTYAMAKQTPPCASISIQDFEGKNNLYFEMPIFATFTNTISYLASCGAEVKIHLTAEDVTEITVTNYYPGYDIEAMSSEEVDYGVESKKVTYTDPEKIQEILDHSGSWTGNNPFLTGDYFNGQYSLELQLKGVRYGVSSYEFKSGEVPEFVKDDTN